MNNKIKDTFDNIHAEEELKAKTKIFLAQKIQTYSNRKPTKYYRFLYVAACFIFIFIGCGFFWTYFTPTATISIDVNPSIELNINRFDKVISVKSYNDDGEELANALNIQFATYTEAVDQLLQNQTITNLLSKDEILTIAVFGSDEEQCQKMLSNIESCAAKQKNTYCYFANEADVATAHELGLSYGKYKVFLELQTLDPEITAEQVQGMTMKEIRDLIKSLSIGNSNDEDTNHWHSSSGNGHGYNNGNGKKNGKKEN